MFDHRKKVYTLRVEYTVTNPLKSCNNFFTNTKSAGPPTPPAAYREALGDIVRAVESRLPFIYIEVVSAKHF